MRKSILLALLLHSCFASAQSDTTHSHSKEIYHSLNGKPNGIYGGFQFIYDLKGKTYSAHFSRKWLVGVDVLHAKKTNFILGFDIGVKYIRITGFGNFDYSQTFTKEFKDDFAAAYHNVSLPIDDSIIGDAYSKSIVDSARYSYGACRDLNFGITFGYRFPKLKVMCRFFAGTESGILRSPNEKHFGDPNDPEGYKIYNRTNQTGFELSANILYPLFPNCFFFEHLCFSFQFYKNYFNSFKAEGVYMQNYTNDAFVAKYNKEYRTGFSIGYIFRD